MAKVSYRHTYAVILRLKQSLSRLVRATDITTQILFVLYAGYSIFAHKDEMFLLIVYSILCSLSFAFLVFILLFGKRDEKKLKKNVRRTYKILKYVIRVAIIAYSIYLIAIKDMSDLGIMLTIASGVILVAQLIIDFIVDFVNAYLELFMESIKWDYEDSEIIRSVVNIVSKKDETEKKNNMLSKISNYVTKKITDMGKENEKPKKPLSEASIARRKLINSFEEELIVNKNVIEPEEQENNENISLIENK